MRFSLKTRSLAASDFEYMLRRSLNHLRNWYEIRTLEYSGKRADANSVVFRFCSLVERVAHVLLLRGKSRP